MLDFSLAITRNCLLQLCDTFADCETPRSASTHPHAGHILPTSSEPYGRRMLTPSLLTAIMLT